MEKELKDILKVDYRNSKVNFELSYGYLDKVYEAFDYRSGSNKSIEKFILNLNDESLEDGQYALLEDLEDKMFNMELNLDGLEYKGEGRLQKSFSPDGLNINLHLSEDVG